MSRPVTIEELRRVLEALRGVDYRSLSLLGTHADAALAALPAEQERSDEHYEPLCPKWSDFALADEPQPASSAVPELPPKPTDLTLAADLSMWTAVVRWDTYEALRTAAESLRERLGEALRERDAYKRAKQENDDRFMLERDAAIARAEQAERRLREVEQQEPVAWEHGRADEEGWRYPNYSRTSCTGWKVRPLYAAPPSAAAARREALLEVAQECERRTAAAEREGFCWSGYSALATWCCERAEEVQQ